MVNHLSSLIGEYPHPWQESEALQKSAEIKTTADGSFTLSYGDAT
jgi:hypothetical protein